MSNKTSTYVLQPGYKYFKAGSTRRCPPGTRVEFTDNQALAFRDAFRKADMVDAEAKVLLATAQQHIEDKEESEKNELSERLSVMTVVDLAQEISEINQKDRLESYTQAELAGSNREGVLNAITTRLEQLGGSDDD